MMMMMTIDSLVVKDVEVNLEIHGMNRNNEVVLHNHYFQQFHLKRQIKKKKGNIIVFIFNNGNLVVEYSFSFWFNEKDKKNQTFECAFSLPLQKNRGCPANNGSRSLGRNVGQTRSTSSQIDW